jgi:hypothetical protein
MKLWFETKLEKFGDPLVEKHWYRVVMIMASIIY